MRKIGFNSQRNNFDFAGKFKGYQQCFATSAWMFMSFFSERFRADDDKQLSRYVDDVCNEVGESGIGEEEAKYNKLSGNSAYYWLVQSAGMLGGDALFAEFLMATGAITENTETAVAQAMRDILGVASRAELRTNDEAAKRFAVLRNDFIKWRDNKNT